MKNQPKLFKNKKIILIIGVVVIVVAIVIGAYAVINNANNSTDQNPSTAELKASADRLKEQAIKAQASDNDAKAVELLEQAKSKYESAGDKNNAVDAEALINISKYKQ